MKSKQQIMQKIQQQGAQITPLREQVLDIILQADGVIKAYQVLAQMQLHSKTAVAPPTAYRALDFWAEYGVLHKIPAVNGYVLCSHVQHECGGHCDAEAAYHGSSFILVCTECGMVDEQSLTPQWQALHEAVSGAGFHLNQEHVVLTGICRHCQSPK